MGIFCNSREEDVSVISRIVEVSLDFYNNQGPETKSGISVTTTGEFEHISEVGGQILSEFISPTVMDRVATLLVLANAFPVFALRKNGRPFLDLQARRKFLSRFTCLFVQAALATMGVEDEGGQVLFYRWIGFPKPYLLDRLLTYLEWIDPTKVMQQITKRGPGNLTDDTKTLAQLSLGCAMALAHCVSSEPLPKQSTPLLGI
jgi:hypothetical protein